MPKFDDTKLRTSLGAVGATGSSLFQKERALLTGGRDVARTKIGEQDVNLQDAYRRSVKFGSFTNLTQSPRERALAQAQKDLGIESGIEDVAFDPSKVDITGDLAELSAKHGVGQNVFIEARRAQAPPGSVTSDVGEAGGLEEEAFKLRTALPTTGTAQKTTNFWDASRGVNVNAPTGSHFELFSGGGVRVVQGPIPEGEADHITSSLFTQSTVGDKPTPGFQQEELGLEPAEGKTIKRTGQTIKNPLTGVDVHASEGAILIEYTDGTVEERSIESINQPGEATAIGEFGPTPEELGITRKTEIKGGAGTEVTREPITETVSQMQARGASPDEIEARIAAEGDLVATSETTFVGSQSDGHTAGEGNAFFRAPDGTLLERPASLQQFAKSPAVEGAGEAIGAGGLQLSNDVLSAANNFGIDLSGDAATNKILEQLRSSPSVGVEQMYENIMNKQGVSTIGQNLDLIQKKMTAEREKFNDQIEIIDSNPWDSEALRVEKSRRAEEKFERNRAGLAAELQLWTSLQDSARQEAQFITSQAVAQANADRAFDMSIAQLAFDRMDQKFNAQVQLANLGLQEQQLKQSAAQFAQNMALQREEIEIAKAQFGQTLGLQQQQFGLTQEQFRQGQQEFSLNLAEQQRQFNKEFGLSASREARLGTRGSGGGGGGGGGGPVSTGLPALPTGVSDSDYIGIAREALTTTELNSVTKLGTKEANRQLTGLGRDLHQALQNDLQMSITPDAAKQIIRQQQQELGEETVQTQRPSTANPFR